MYIFCSLISNWQSKIRVFLSVWHSKQKHSEQRREGEGKKVYCLLVFLLFPTPPPPPPPFLSMCMCRRKVSIMDFSPENLARQMTILDNELFQKLDVRNIKVVIVTWTPFLSLFFLFIFIPPFLSLTFHFFPNFS